MALKDLFSARLCHWFRPRHAETEWLEKEIARKQDEIRNLTERHAQLTGRATTLADSVSHSNITNPISGGDVNKLTSTPGVSSVNTTLSSPTQTSGELSGKETQGRSPATASTEHTSPSTKSVGLQVDTVTLSTSLVDRRFESPRAIDKSSISIGDISWFPVLQPSLSNSPRNIQTQFGAVCAKMYPIVIVDTLDDCMIGLTISTATGNGLSRKPSSVRRRSVEVIKEPASTIAERVDAPQPVLEVNRQSRYSPASGAFIDTFAIVRVPCDTRFEKAGSLSEKSAQYLQQMRLHAHLSSSAEIMGIDEICTCIAEWLLAWRAAHGER